MGWIDTILDFTGLSSLARKVWGAITQFWNVFVAIGLGLVRGSIYMYWRFYNLYTAAARFVDTLARLCVWFTFVFVPRWATWAFNASVAQALQWVNDTRTLAQGWIAAAKNALVDLITDVVKTFNAWVDWVRQTFASVINTLNWVFGRVSLLLTDPEAFATWALGGLWTVGRRWLVSNATLVGRWVLANAVSGAISGAGILEDVLLRIL